MPNTQINKSAEKRVRQDARKRAKNRVARGYIRDMMRNVRATTDPEETKNSLNHAYRTLDRAVSKGLMHKKTAARHKSRLASHINKVQ